MDHCYSMVPWLPTDACCTGSAQRQVRSSWVRLLFPVVAVSGAHKECVSLCCSMPNCEAGGMCGCMLAMLQVLVWALRQLLFK